MLILVIDDWCISCEIDDRWMLLDLTDDKSTLVQVMAWCHQATSHYLSQCWPRSMSPYGVIRPQRVNLLTLWLQCLSQSSNQKRLKTTFFICRSHVKGRLFPRPHSGSTWHVKSTKNTYVTSWPKPLSTKHWTWNALDKSRSNGNWKKSQKLNWFVE